MKDLFFLALAIFSFSFSNAQTFKIDSWVKPTENELGNTSSIFVIKKLSKNLTFVGFALTSTTGFAESYFGLSKKIAKNIDVSLSVGFQAKSEKPLRFGSSLFTKQGKYSFLAIGEYGINKTYWYKYQLKVNTGKLSPSLYGQRFAGHGIRWDYSFGKIGVWAAGLYDTEAGIYNTPFGVYVKI